MMYNFERRSVVQMEEYTVRDREVGGSSPPAPTLKLHEKRFRLWLLNHFVQNVNQ